MLSVHDGMEALLKACDIQLFILENSRAQKTDVMINAKDLGLFDQFLRLENISTQQYNNIVKLSTKKDIKALVEDLYEFISDTKKYRLMRNKQKLYNF